MGPCRLLKTIFAQFLGKYRVVSALFGKIERLTFTGTFDAFQHLVKSHSFKQICFPHRSEMGVLKSFPESVVERMQPKAYFYTTRCIRSERFDPTELGSTKVLWQKFSAVGCRRPDCPTCGRQNTAYGTRGNAYARA